jgi:uncharacterized protein (TIGR02118 family)
MVRFLVVYSNPKNPDGFERHYTTAHIPLVKRLPGLRRFTLSQDSRNMRGEEANFLVAELDWDDLDSLRAAFQSPAGQAVFLDVRDNLARICPTMNTMIYEVEEIYSAF